MRNLCQRYELETNARYEHVETTEALPGQVNTDARNIMHGYVTHLGNSGLFFFDAIEPAITFGQAGRMSSDVRMWGVSKAAVEVMFCPKHSRDERVLYIQSGADLDRQNDVTHIKRFVQSVKEHEWSSHWHETTGNITNSDGQITGRSLPL